ncbi:MAG: prolipoprotein diacylglyceryl transferase [Deltaproteobacteria bacterium]|nr:prolipoprotein diacylglyceryl transferase [Deltaproteobacteria bacterium]
MYPILYDLGPIRIFTYGFFLALAFMTAIFIAGREARRQGIHPGRFYDMCFLIIVSALAGSRLLFVILEYDRFIANPLKIFAMWEGGLVFHGGLIAAVVMAFWYMRRHGLPWRATFDALAVGMPFGQALGRIGCFMAGCCYGTPSSLPWAVTFTHPETLCPVREPLHPSQLYEAGLALGVFAVVFWLRTRKRFDGQVILTYFCLAGLVRFTVEFVRHPGDYRGPVWFGMPSTQVTALVIALLSGAVLLWALLRARRSQL